MMLAKKLGPPLPAEQILNELALCLQVRAFFDTPLAHEDFPVMITLPSEKDTAWRSEHPDRTTIQARRREGEPACASAI